MFLETQGSPSPWKRQSASQPLSATACATRITSNALVIIRVSLKGTFSGRYLRSCATQNSCLSARTRFGRLTSPKSMCKAPHVSWSTRMLLPCRSPKPMIWPTKPVHARQGHAVHIVERLTANTDSPCEVGPPSDPDFGIWAPLPQHVLQVGCNRSARWHHRPRCSGRALLGVGEGAPQTLDLDF